LGLALVAAYSAQLSAMQLGNFARETDIATFGCNSAVEMVTARPFMDMIDPDPVMGSVDTDELAALQPPFDPRGFATFKADPGKYPDAPSEDYVAIDTALYNKVLRYGARVWEPVAVPTMKVDPTSSTQYMVYPLGTLQKAKVLTWFEPRPTLLDGTTGPFSSPISKKNSLGFAKLVPQLIDPKDEASSLPTTVIVAVAWFPTATQHDVNIVGSINPLDLFIPPIDGTWTFTAPEAEALRQKREALKAKGVRVQYHKTVVKP
jgi:hypothetical protein